MTLLPSRSAIGKGENLIRVHIQWNLKNYGHIGTSHFVFYREVVSLRRLKCTSMIEKGPQSVSFIERFSLLCPLFGVSIIRGSTVLAGDTKKGEI